MGNQCRRGVDLLIPGLLLILALGSASNADQVFFNARLALDEQRAEDVLRLWLLRNSLEAQGQSSPHDAEFESMVWVALGELGYCGDGFQLDTAGLWSISVHNGLAMNVSRRPPIDPPNAFDAFELDRQQRRVDLHDVLGPDELSVVRFERTHCWLPRLLNNRSRLTRFFGAPEGRLATARLMQVLLEHSKRILDPSRVENLELLDARLFDLDLLITQLSQRELRAG
ncbi:MAG: hypothetical protein AAFQ82_26270, partial [Myxococcota bacterium]